MKIYNRENIITNKQLNKFLKIVSPKVIPSKIIISESIIESFKSLIRLMKINTEGWCLLVPSTINVNLYNLPKGKMNKQLYGLGVILHELKHLEGVVDEEECDNFAKKFLNNNSRKISEIMGWKREYKVLEF